MDMDAALKAHQAKMEKLRAEHVKYGDEGADITLSKPITIDGTKVKALRMREPTVRDSRLASKSADGDSETMELQLFANLCDISLDNIESMTQRDYARVQAAFMGFTD
jgi:hypothetical protein